jgi:spoIIIJ-associated protein
MKTIQATAKNVQKAIEQGLKELGVSQEEVDIKVLDEGGLFRKAKVELSYDDGVVEVKPSKEEKKAEKAEKKAEKKVSKEEEKSSKKEEKNSEKTDVEKVGKDFLKELLEKMKVQAEVEFTKTEDGVLFNASGEHVSALIGRRGETLNAIQELLKNVLKNKGYREGRVYFDVENYKNRREIALVELAERMASKAVRYGKPVRLDRMNAYERKIIHTALQNFEGVTTQSEGEEPNRHLVIIPEEQE